MADAYGASIHDISGRRCDLCGQTCDSSAEELNALDCTYPDCPPDAHVYHQDCLERYLKQAGLERNRKTGFKCPRGCGKGTLFDKPCPGKIDKSHPIHARNEESKKRRKAKMPEPVQETIAPKFGPAAKAAAKAAHAAAAPAGPSGVMSGLVSSSVPADKVKDKDRDKSPPSGLAPPASLLKARDKTPGGGVAVVSPAMAPVGPTPSAKAGPATNGPTGLSATAARAAVKAAKAGPALSVEALAAAKDAARRELGLGGGNVGHASTARPPPGSGVEYGHLAPGGAMGANGGQHAANGNHHHQQQQQQQQQSQQPHGHAQGNAWSKAAAAAAAAAAHPMSANIPAAPPPVWPPVSAAMVSKAGSALGGAPGSAMPPYGGLVGPSTGHMFGAAPPLPAGPPPSRDPHPGYADSHESGSVGGRDVPRVPVGAEGDDDDGPDTAKSKAQKKNERKREKRAAERAAAEAAAAAESSRHVRRVATDSDRAAASLMARKLSRARDALAELGFPSWLASRALHAVGLGSAGVDAAADWICADRGGQHSEASPWVESSRPHAHVDISSELADLAELQAMGVWPPAAVCAAVADCAGDLAQAAVVLLERAPPLEVTVTAVVPAVAPQPLYPHPPQVAAAAATRTPLPLFGAPVVAPALQLRPPSTGDGVSFVAGLGLRQTTHDPWTTGAVAVGTGSVTTASLGLGGVTRGGVGGAPSEVRSAPTSLFGAGPFSTAFFGASRAGDADAAAWSAPRVGDLPCPPVSSHGYDAGMGGGAATGGGSRLERYQTRLPAPAPPAPSFLDKRPLVYDWRRGGDGGAVGMLGPIAGAPAPVRSNGVYGAPAAGAYLAQGQGGAVHGPDHIDLSWLLTND